MANTYEVSGVHLIRIAGVTKIIFEGSVVDDVTGNRSSLRQMIDVVSGPIQTRVDNIMQDAVTFANAKWPGATFVLSDG